MRPWKARNGNVAAQATRRQLDHENHACLKRIPQDADEVS